MKKNLLFLLAFLFCSSMFAQTPVEINGELKLVGNQLSNEEGHPVQLRGMSSHGLHWYGQCVTKESLKALRDDWGADIFRAAMYVGEGGYENNPSLATKVDQIVEWTEELGIYCLVDWHVHDPGDPNSSTYNGAEEFFKAASEKYKDKKHVLYEICNEPNSKNSADDSWDNIKKYANKIIPVIRENDPTSIIIVGTPNWSQLNVWDKSIVNDQLDYENIMYTFHFYAGTHGGLQSDFKKRICELPVFVTEWGTTAANGNDGVFKDETQPWIDIMAGDNTCGVTISWCNWSFADKDESSAALSPGACGQGKWNSTSLSGGYVKEWMSTPDDFTPIGQNGSTPPSYSYGSYDSETMIVSAKFSQTLKSVSSSDKYNFTVSINGAEANITNVELASDGKTIELTIDDAVAFGDVLKLDYDGSSITNESDVKLEAFTGKSVKNNTPSDTAGGASDDFNDNDLSDSWAGGTSFTLNESNQELQVNANVSGYTSLSFGFDPIDISSNPIVKVDVKSSVEFDLRIDLQACVGTACKTTNLDANVVTVVGNNSYKTYTFDFTGKFKEAWNSAGEEVSPADDVDATAITTLLLYANAGDTFNGTFNIDNIIVGSKPVELESFSLSESSLSLEVNEEKAITVDFTPANASDKTITWTSSDNDVVTVKNGKIVAVAEGSATITAKSSVSGVASQTISVSVSGFAQADLTEINKLITEAEGLIAAMDDKFPASALETLKAELTTAQNAIGGSDLTQQTVDDAEEDLALAIKAYKDSEITVGFYAIKGDNQVKVYPIPMQISVTVESPADPVKEIQIVSTTGSAVISQNYTGETKVTIPTKELNTGNYHIFITGESGTTYAYPIVKQ